MVRRLPVLQHTQTEQHLRLGHGVAAAAALATLLWAPLLWLLGRWGTFAVAVGYLCSCALATFTVAARVAQAQRVRLAILSAGACSLGLWGLAWMSGVFSSLVAALAAFVAIALLSLVGFPAGLLVLFWRQRSATRSQP